MPVRMRIWLIMIGNCAPVVGSLAASTPPRLPGEPEGLGLVVPAPRLPPVGLGEGVAELVGLGVGRQDELGVGLQVGVGPGLQVGFRMCLQVGLGMGFLLGVGVGLPVGEGDGFQVGEVVGFQVGVAMGLHDGVAVGRPVGVGVGVGPVYPMNVGLIEIVAPPPWYGFPAWIGNRHLIRKVLEKVALSTDQATVFDGLKLRQYAAVG